MEGLKVPQQPSLCVISDDAGLVDEISRHCPPESKITHFQLSGILDITGGPAPEMAEIEKAARRADAVLVEWSLQHAPLIGTLAYRVRLLPIPLIGLVGDDPSDSIAALIVGVDHTHQLPLSVPLLGAQILAHLRTVHTAAAPAPAPEQRASRLEAGDLALDPRQYRFFIRGETVKLTPHQFRFLMYLMQRREDLVTRDEILEHVWKIGFEPGTNIVDVYIHFLRRLLKQHGAGATIETVRGRGYRFTGSQ